MDAEKIIFLILKVGTSLIFAGLIGVIFDEMHYEYCSRFEKISYCVMLAIIAAMCYGLWAYV